MFPICATQAVTPTSPTRAVWTALVRICEELLGAEAVVPKLLFGANITQILFAQLSNSGWERADRSQKSLNMEGCTWE